MGSIFSQLFMTAQGLCVGADAERLGKQRDMTRERNSRRYVETKEKHRRKVVREAKEKERKRQEEEEGGPAYAAGAF